MVLANYMRDSMNLSALGNLSVIYIITHDSREADEDGPIHQPIEIIPSLHAMPNLLVWRPDNENSGAYEMVMRKRNRPNCHCLSRQGMANKAHSSINKVAQGG